MAKKRVATSRVSQLPSEPKFCGDCMYAEEDRKFINKSIKGEYFCVRCKYYMEGKYVRLKTWEACNKFIRKPKKDL